MQTTMRATRVLSLQPSRAFQMRATRALRLQTSPTRFLHQTRPRMMPVPKEEHSAHTISQRLRTLKKIPVELLPLGFVMIVAIVAAVYSMGRKLVTDKTLRLTRSGGVSHRNQEPKPSH